MTHHYLCAKQHMANFYSDHEEKKSLETRGTPQSIIVAVARVM